MATIQEMCSNSTQCANTTVNVPNRTTVAANTSHSMSIKQTARIMDASYDIQSFERTFFVSYNKDAAENIDAVVASQDATYLCKTDSTQKHFGTVYEDCVQTTIVPMYLDLTNHIFVYKKLVETIKFSTNVHPVMAKFKLTTGVGLFWKFVIKKTGDKEYLQKTETFHVVHDNSVEEIHRTETSINPFDQVQTQASWGLYGNLVFNTNQETFDPTVRQLLIFPNPPALAIPQDFGSDAAPSVNNYGFYDYNSIDAGFEKTGDKLGETDGGKDYFYPKWLRQMTPNTIMQTWASTRWNHNWNKQIIPASSDFTPPTITIYGWPFGSFVKDKNNNWIHSAIFTAMDGTTFSYNNSNINNLFSSINSYGQPLHGGENLYFPITLVTNV